MLPQRQLPMALRGWIGCSRAWTSPAQRLTPHNETRTLFASYSTPALSHTEQTVSRIPTASAARKITRNEQKRKEAAYLQAMASQPRLYATVDILGHAFTMTATDILHVPRLRDAKVGDVLTFDKVKEIGGPQFAMHGSPHINPEWHKIQCRVMEHPLSAKLHTEKFKRRKNYHRKIGHRQRYTVLRCTNVVVNTP